MNTIAQKYGHSQCFVLTDEHVECLLAGLGVEQYPRLVLPAGEEHKTLATVERIWDFLIEQGATRQSLLINVGGGVVTDMGGFAAATYQRGIDYVNVPTTLLAMVDAASGGKTGFDYRGLKNQIGVFRAPLDTLYDVRLLASLPMREFLSGYAEMLKHALIADAAELVHLLAFDLDSVASESFAVDFAPRLSASIAIKDRVVEADPLEKGLRKTLNFGHTIGHALETLSLEQSQQTSEPAMPHGYAVMYGMIAELYLSHVVQGLESSVITEMAHFMVENYGRISVSCRHYERLLDIMRHDKKNSCPGEINFTLLRHVGEPVINQSASDALIREALDYLFSV